MNDTPEWLRLLMERDPRAEDPAPQGAAHEERMLAFPARRHGGWGQGSRACPRTA